jgi:hypothetical protein
MPILSELPAPAVRPCGESRLAGAKLGWPGATSIGRCKCAEVRQLPTTSLTQVRLHISGDNTPPPSKKCRRNSLYSAEAHGPPHGRALAAPATGDSRGRSGPLEYPL